MLYFRMLQKYAIPWMLKKSAPAPNKVWNWNSEDPTSHPLPFFLPPVSVASWTLQSEMCLHMLSIHGLTKCPSMPGTEGSLKPGICMFTNALPHRRTLLDTHTQARTPELLYLRMKRKISNVIQPTRILKPPQDDGFELLAGTQKGKNIFQDAFQKQKYLAMSKV